MLSACAGGTFQTAGQYESGKQALYAGNYPTALGYFQEAAQTNPNAVYGATLRLGILTYVGQTQYLTGTMRRRVRLYVKSFRSTRATMSHCYTLALRKLVSETARPRWGISKTA